MSEKPIARGSAARGAEDLEASQGGGEGDLSFDPVVGEELELLSRVRSALEALPEAKNASQAPLVRELERLREVMISGGENKDLPALTEQWHHQAAVLSQLRRAGAPAQVDPGSPYFAHLRLREDGAERDLCLGRVTCIKRGLRIVDWRDAPISKIFYRYQQGESFDEEIAGRERMGEVVLRRLVRIRDGALERVQAPEGDFESESEAPGGWRRREHRSARLAGGESVALRAHGPGEGAARRLGSDHHGLEYRADKRLPEITGLIDAEQFGLITRQAAGFLVIRGAAGSGKTTVALHRVAYLAYDDERIDSSQTLVVMFSRGLRNYVSHLLPSLGLSQVRVVTYPDWVAEERRRHFPRLPSKVREDTPALVQRLKLHPVLAAALEEQVKQVAGSATWEQAFDDWSSVLSGARGIEQAQERLGEGAFSSAEIAKFVDWNRGRIDELCGALAGEPGAVGELDPEDDALLLRAWQLRVGPLRGRGGRLLRYRHAVLDEVQDFAPLEVQVLLDCLGDDSSITLAGDTQQHVMQTSGFSSWSDFFVHLGIEGSAVETLKVSYRSSEEIVRFAFSLLGDLQEEEAMPEATRSGPPVELFRFTDRGACVAFLADALRELMRTEPLASVAILTPSEEASRTYTEGLATSDVPCLRRIVDQDFTFAPGIEVTEIEQAKGLEFDYVILADVTAVHYPDLPASRRLLHVGATRAVHQLWLTSVGTPSPLLAALPEA
ncbi:MAG: ATP-binding domain-containing protein [Deltaproteobacteria bacterium]|nr:ATP-binding domain-containing protein [Deltaproteobacteria bacterium]